MASAHNHPRRRPVSPTVDSLAESLKAISLQKTSTFQVLLKEEPEVLKSFLEGHAYPNLPARSATCPKALEDLLIGPGERRTADLLQRVDDAIARRGELTSVFREPRSRPALVTHESDAVAGGTRYSDKDSGIGSSIDTAPASPTSERLGRLGGKNNLKSFTAINRSFSGEDDRSRRQLSGFAAQQVQKYLTEPILREATLRHFHPLIESIPERVLSREIGTLRDLEKTLIYLAPDYAQSPRAFQVFCEVSTRCLHTTVKNVHDSDRCLPQDRPYTTGYFIDLVEQMRRYATILAATREREQHNRGFPDDKVEADGKDRIELHGGVHQDGKPAVLVRVRGGQRVSLADGRPIAREDLASGPKRPAMDGAGGEIDEDSALRSMARRKKGEPIRTYHCNQTGCAKHFKRPCDLTKHIKTHERPYKCPEAGCKYYDLGWPTEKECERHVNDKHSETPMMYKCVVEGCPYTSKRESNCKQHMEKAHNIPYVRSKSKNKGKAPIRISKATSSPSPIGDAVVDISLTPPIWSSSIVSTMSGASPVVPASSASSYASSVNEDFTMDSDFDFNFDPDFASHFNTEYLDPSPSVPISPAWTEDRRGSNATSITNYSPLDVPMVEFDNAMFKTGDYDFNMVDENIHFQSPGFGAANDFTSSHHEASGLADGGVAYTLDDNFEPATDNSYDADFQLYSTTPAGPSNSATQESQPLDHVGGHFSGGSQGQTDLMTLFPELIPQ